MGVKTGLKSYLGIGFATVWGTAVSRTNWLEVLSVPGQRTIETAPRPSLGFQGAQSNVSPADRYVVADNHGGTIPFAVSYDDSSIALIAEAMGGTAVVTESGAGPYVHTIQMGGASDDQIPLTLELGRGNEGADVVNTALITGLTLSLSPGGYFMGEVEYIGQTSTRGSSGSPTYAPSAHLCMHHHASQWTFDGVDYDLVDFKVRLARNLVRRPILGSSFSARPAPNGMTTIQMEVTVEAAGDALHAAYVAGTLSTASITLTDSTRSMVIGLTNSRIIACSDPVSSGGVIRRTLTLEATATAAVATTQGLRITVTNGLATYRTNA